MASITMVTGSGHLVSSLIACKETWHEHRPVYRLFRRSRKVLPSLCGERCIKNGINSRQQVDCNVLCHAYCYAFTLG